MTTLDKMLQGLANALGASLSTLTTTAKTVVGAINELKSGLTTANTNISTNTTKIGSGSLNTTAQTIIPAINELNGQIFTSAFAKGTLTNVTSTTTNRTVFTPNASGVCFLEIGVTNSSSIYSYYQSGFEEYKQLSNPNGLIQFLGKVTAGVPVIFSAYSSNSNYKTIDYTYVIF